MRSKAILVAGSYRVHVETEVAYTEYLVIERDNKNGDDHLTLESAANQGAARRTTRVHLATGAREAKSRNQAFLMAFY